MSERVAVIAVHGVADQLPFATARATADLLRCRTDGKIVGFTEETLRLEVEPIRSGDTSSQVEPLKLQQELATQVTVGVELKGESRSEIAELGRQSLVKSQEPFASLDQDQLERDEILRVSHEKTTEYFTAQLKDYQQQPADAVYETVRLSSKLDCNTVDIYEMYWADLSRVRLGILNAIEELYYVLFTVCSIGNMELDRSRGLFTTWRWWLFHGCASWAGWILTTIVPIGNVFLLLLFVFTIPHLLPPPVSLLAKVSIGIGTGILGASFWFIWKSRETPFRDRRRIAMGAVVGAVFGAVLHLLSLGSTDATHVVLCVLLWALSAGGLMAFGFFLNKRLPGSSRVSKCVAAVSFFVVFREAIRFQSDTTYWALQTGLAVAEWVSVGLVTCWLIYMFLSMMCSVLGLWVKLAERKGSPLRDVARRIAWTANLAILAPGMLSIVLNLGIWQAANVAGRNWLEPLLPKSVIHTPIKPLHAAMMRHAEPPRPPLATVITANDVPGLLIQMTSIPMAVIVAGVLVMLLSAGWVLLPAILAEGGFSQDTNYSRELGKSLSRAWRTMRRWSIVFVQLLMIGVFVLNVWLLFQTPAPALRQIGNSMLVVTGAVFLFFATGASQFAGLRTVIDVAADVANWLRLHPRDNNPTSRITARYVSLLRYVTEQKDDDGNPLYDRVVIFAHSLGSAITVDVLQYLKVKPDPTLLTLNADKIPIGLFTHGCPLRQLLGLRLPITYGWARHGDGEWQKNVEPNVEELLGVAIWVNSYCSGDYVGRHLWHNDDKDDSDLPWELTPQRRDGAVCRIELCAGPGAHTHYWDPIPRSSLLQAPSNQVAQVLIQLINE